RRVSLRALRVNVGHAACCSSPRRSLRNLLRPAHPSATPNLGSHKVFLEGAVNVVRASPPKNHSCRSFEHGEGLGDLTRVSEGPPERGSPHPPPLIEPIGWMVSAVRARSL